MLHSGTVLSDVHGITPFFLTAQWNRYYYCPHFAAKETEGQRDSVSHPKSHIAGNNRLGIKSKQPDAKAEP